MEAELEAFEPVARFKQAEKNLDDLDSMSEKIAFRFREHQGSGNDPSQEGAARRIVRADNRHRLEIETKVRREELRMLAERTGFIIWVSDVKARNLEKYGSAHISRRMHYVVMYVNADRAEETMKNIRRLSYVRKIERSYRNEIKTE